MFEPMGAWIEGGGRSLAKPPEPTIFCEYWYAELPRVFGDVELLMKGLLPGDILRLSTVHLEALLAVPEWCQATGNKLIGRTQICQYGLGLQYFFDIERGADNVHSASLPRG